MKRLICTVAVALAMMIPQTTAAADGSLFATRATDGAVVVAQTVKGPASNHSCRVAEAGRCPVVTFDFSAPGLRWYRLVVSPSSYPLSGSRKAEVIPVSIPTLYRVTHRDDSSTLVNPDKVPVDAIAFRTQGVAKVRVRLASGRTVQMRPVDGWAAFARRNSGSHTAFRARWAEGLGADGNVVARAVAFRCC
jgi:hypothetical protein